MPGDPVLQQRADLECNNGRSLDINKAETLLPPRDEEFIFRDTFLPFVYVIFAITIFTSRVLILRRFLPLSSPSHRCVSDK